ncbi:MAG TPA: DUF6093 family protein [Acidimicrobiales bacterium]|nr:DUF6093 family protein [Acidimicrobiales bacterium]
MSIAELLSQGRAAAEALMTDTCQITKPGTGDPVYDSATGTYAPPAPVEVYNGKCKLKTPHVVNPFQADGAGTPWQVEQATLSLPADAPSIEQGWTVNYLTAPYNTVLEGRVFGVTGPAHGSQTTAQRVLVQEVVGTGA